MEIYGNVVKLYIPVELLIRSALSSPIIYYDMPSKMISNESMLENYGGLHINSLNHILSSNNDEAPEVIQTSNYYDQESLAGIFTTNIS